MKQKIESYTADNNRPAECPNGFPLRGLTWKEKVRKAREEIERTTRTNQMLNDPANALKGMQQIRDFNTTSTASGLKFDEGKPEMSLLPAAALRKIATVLTLGKQKYGVHNWREGIVYSRLLSAAIRHIYEYLDGVDRDPETNQSPLAHAASALMFLLAFEDDRPDLDDRYKKKKEPIQNETDGKA